MAKDQEVKVSQMKEYIQELGSSTEAYYPERLERIYILNMPWFFVSVWKMISYFLEKETLDKIVIVKNEEQRKRFVMEIGTEALAEEFGGEAKLVAHQAVEATRLEF